LLAICISAWPPVFLAHSLHESQNLAVLTSRIAAQLSIMSSKPPRTGSSEAETSARVGLVNLPRAAQLSFQPISARSWKSQAGLASIKTSGYGCDDLPAAVSQFVLEICNLQLQQYHLSSLGEQALNLNVGQGMDYSVELSRTNDGEVVAVKHQKIETCDTSVASGGLLGQKVRRIRKALKEIQIMSHPPIHGCSNVLSVRGYGWTYVGGETMTPALVVEFASQGNLRQYLKMESAKSDSEKWNILHGVAKGLLSLHHSGIVHGDIKMENVLVAAMADGTFVPKIADFGSSIITTSREHQPYWGTDIYNSPEIRLRTLNLLDTNQLVYCDMWAFGLLALEVALDGECYIDQETTSCIEHPHMEGFEESCFRRLNRAAFNDPGRKSGFASIITKALKRTALDRGTIDEFSELFIGNHDTER
jgi:serine/threonine protein kinase